jgi:PhzF family phenazine biosynthesis protein
MQGPIFQLDAFTGELFRGNPAAVCPLDRWLDDDLLGAIAAENNLSETAFFIPDGDEYGLRWFTPTAEVDLCGHATLASGWVIFHRIAPDRASVRFRTRGGELNVEREEELLAMDFPARPAEPKDAPRALVEGLGVKPVEVLAAARDYLVVLETEEEVRRLKPDFNRLRTLDRLGIIVTAAGTGCDFVSRFFAPGVGVPEDPVTGSAHCTLIPYWASRLEREDPGAQLHARQISARGGELFCQDLGERVRIAGRVVLYLEGTIHV